MSESIVQVASQQKTSEINSLMTEKLETYNKITNFVNKNKIYLCGIMVQIDHPKFVSRQIEFMGKKISYYN